MPIVTAKGFSDYTSGTSERICYSRVHAREVTIGTTSHGRTLTQDWTQEIGVITSILVLISRVFQDFEYDLPLKGSNKHHHKA